MTDAETLRALLREHIHDAGTQWNLGTFGAIAEFMRDPGEACTIVDRPDRLCATTARGGIGFGSLAGISPFASESATGASWSHRVALCLPADACAMSGRSTLTELGPDEDALREEDRTAILFDMGLSTLQADICIRTADPALIGALRAEAGRPLFAPGNGAMGAIVSAGPHRIFIARFGRCEVYQPIPPADGKSPEGPHTHVLPKLLRTGRTHAATEPIPDGFVPCAHLVPAHAAKDALGRPRPWDEHAHRRFQRLLEAYGDAELVRLKRDLLAAIHGGSQPNSVSAPMARAASHSLKAGLRQLAASTERPLGLERWLAAFDIRTIDDGAPEDGDAYGHA